MLDFGLAAQIHTSFSRVSHVRYGTSGTGPYMAPEQWEGQYQDAATDQYALAVLAYELLTGHCPFEGHDATVLRESVLKSALKCPPGMPPPVWAALDRALAKEREARFSSCGDFARALGGARIERRNVRKARQGSLPSRRAGGWKWAVGMLLLAGLGWGGYGAYRTQRFWAGGTRKPPAKEAPVVESTPLNALPAAQIRDLSVEATLLRNEVMEYENGQGFGERKREVDRQWHLGEKAYDEQDLAAAAAAYGEVVRLGGELRETEAIRKRAADGEHQTEAVRQQAQAVGASADASALFGAGEALAQTAADLYDAGRFAEAEGKWRESADRYRSAEEHAAAVAQCRQAKDAFTQELSRTGLAKAQLEAYGGTAWTNVCAHYQKGTQREDADPSAAGTEYAAATAALPAAAAAVRSGLSQEANRIADEDHDAYMPLARSGKTEKSLDWLRQNQPGKQAI